MVEAGCFQEHSAFSSSHLEVIDIKPFLIRMRSPWRDAECVEGLSDSWLQIEIIEVPNLRKAEERFFVEDRSSTRNIPGGLETYTTSPPKLLSDVATVRGSVCKSMQCRLQLFVVLEKVSSI